MLAKVEGRCSEKSKRRRETSKIGVTPSGAVATTGTGKDAVLAIAAGCGDADGEELERLAAFALVMRFFLSEGFPG